MGCCVEDGGGQWDSLRQSRRQHRSETKQLPRGVEAAAHCGATSLCWRHFIPKAPSVRKTKDLFCKLHFSSIVSSICRGVREESEQRKELRPHRCTTRANSTARQCSRPLACFTAASMRSAPSTMASEMPVRRVVSAEMLPSLGFTRTCDRGCVSALPCSTLINAISATPLHFPSLHRFRGQGASTRAAGPHPWTSHFLRGRSLWHPKQVRTVVCLRSPF